MNGVQAGHAAPVSRAARWLLWLVPLLWSSNYIIARLAAGVVAPHALAAGRWALAAAILLPWVGAGLWRQRAVLAAEGRQLLVLGLLGMYICGAWLYIAGHSTSATNIALIYAVTPLGVAVFGARLLGERLGLPQWAGVGMALLGLLFVIFQGSLDRLLAVRLTTGDAWAAVAAVSWMAYSVLLKHWPSRLGHFERLVAIMAGGLLVLLPAALVETLFTSTPPLSGRALALIGVAAVLPGLLSYGAYSFLQRELGAARTALMLYLSPLYAALLAWALLGEAPGWYHAVGAALILPSIWLASQKAPAYPNKPGARPGSSSSL